jgi:LSD1 subclass zinc finger protein
MRLRPLGDFYEWYCEWCHSKNLTLWTRFEKGEVVCGACHKRLVLPAGTSDVPYGVCAGIL